MQPEEFFESPRSWSNLKYKILSGYLYKYFPKVNQKYRGAATVADLFAGKGKFEDGSDGSPLIIAKAARTYKERLGFSNKVILADADEKICEDLAVNLKEFVDDRIVTIIPGYAKDVGQEILAAITPGMPLFVLLDPFGIKGLSMSLLDRIFKRASTESTEVLINFNHRGIYRLTGICNNLESDMPLKRKQAESVMKLFTDVLGDNWWEGIVRESGVPEKVKANRILEGYVGIISRKFRWTGSLPVTKDIQGDDEKYFLIFGSRSMVAFELMNDEMKKARTEIASQHIRTANVGTLFESADPAEFLPPQFQTEPAALAKMVLNEVRSYAGAQANYVGNPYNVEVTRPLIRSRLIKRRFGRYTSSEYNHAIKRLLEEGDLASDSGRTAINDAASLKLRSR